MKSAPLSRRDRSDRESHELGFVARQENVIFLGASGGKTYLAISLAIAAAQSGRRVYYGGSPT